MLPVVAARTELGALRRVRPPPRIDVAAAAEAAEKIRDNVAAIRAAAVLDVEATKAAKAAAEADAAASRADRDAAGKELAAAATIRQRLERIFGRVVGWLRGDTLPPAIRAEARALAKEAGVPDLPRPRIDELAATPPTTKKENVRPGLDF